MIQYGKGNQDNPCKQRDEWFRYQLPFKIGCQEIVIKYQQDDRDEPGKSGKTVIALRNGNQCKRHKNQQWQEVQDMEN